MDIFAKFKQAVKIRQVLVDNEVFQLHYRVTAILLLGSAALVASKQHFGDPINCITRDDVPNKIMNTYCWIHATFTLPSACNKTVGIDVPHPCVDKYSGEREERIYHKYYQWVYFVLFFQACCFYAPHLLWKVWESKLLFNLTGSFKNPLFKEDDAKQKDKILDIVNYISRESRHDRHQKYYQYFTLCEIINFVNVLLQIYVVDEFLGGTFTTYGLDVLNYIQMDQEDRVDPMVKVFPRMTKCTFHRFGASGDVQKYDALCILPLNIINEKIYVIMWFWFVLLAIVTGLWLVYRLLTFAKPQVRYRILRRKASHANTKHLRYVLKQVKAGDWFLLSMMCKNMDSQWYRILILELRESIKKESLENRSKRRGNLGDRSVGLTDGTGKDLIIDDGDDEEEDQLGDNSTETDLETDPDSISEIVEQK